MMRLQRTRHRFVLLVLMLLSLTGTSFGQAPGTPIITGRNSTFQGSAGSLTCTSIGGNPVPTVTWYRNDSLVDATTDTPTVTNITSNTYSYTADIGYHLAVFECRVDNTILQSYLSATIFLQVYKEPDQPTLNGPSTVISGTTYEWTCISRGGSPEPIITMTLGDIQLSTGIEQTSVQLSDNTFTVTVVLSWALNFSSTNNNETLSCNVKHEQPQPRGDVVQNASLQLIVLPRIPVVTNPQSAYSETRGQSVTLQCTVFSPDTALQSVSWIFNNGASTNSITQSSNATKYTGTTTTTPSLTITNLSSTDVGTYTCTATNTGGTGISNTISLSVTGNFLTVTIPQSSYSVLIGQHVTISCNVTGTPTQTNVSWIKVVNGVPTDVVINGSSRYSGGTIAAPSLTITNTQFSDEGTYVCYATNIVGTSNSQNTFLDVTGGVPNVTIGGSNFQVEVGNSITIGCTVAANPVMTSLSWTHNVNGLITNIGPSSNPSKYGGSTTVTPSLTIFNADFSDEGTYKCFATNSVGTGESQEISLDVQGAIPTVQVSFPSYNVNYFSSITLICSVVSQPAALQVYWRKTLAGTTTNIDVINSGGKYSGSTISTPSLTVINAASSDEANYTCFATNSVGTGQSISITLYVIGNIPSVNIQQLIYIVNYGSTAVLVCAVIANPTHINVYWRKIKNGVTTDINVANSNNKYSGSTVNNPSLQINNVDLNDEAYYVCFASNSVGSGQSSQTFLDVIGAIPVVIISSNIYSVLLGDTVTLQCTVSSNPAHTSVTWQRIINGVLTTVIVDGSRIIGGTVNSPSITISNAVSGDEGNYICTATNVVGTGSSRQTFLDVTGGIPIVTVGQSQYTANYGQTVTMICTIQANPMVTSVYWRKFVNGNATSINMNNLRYTGSTLGSPSLTISALGISDKGHYECSAQNSVGTGSSGQTYLDVIGDIPSVQILSNYYSVIFGNTVVLDCQVNSNPLVTTVFWQMPNRTIDMTANNFSMYSGSTVQSPSLTIISTTHADIGDYVCFATNAVGTGSSSQTFLDVIGNIPTLNITQSAYSVNVGSQITIPCTVSAIPKETIIYWTVKVDNNTEQTISIMKNTQKYQGSSVNSPSLIILSTTQSDSGVYRCHATNNVGTGHSNPTTLHVVGNKPTVTVARTYYLVDYGNSVELICTVSAAPIHTDVYWTRIQNGLPVTISTVNTAKYSGSTVINPSLTISNVDQNDETYYTCYATNTVGTGQSLHQIFVDVVGSVPAMSIQSNSYSVLLGQTATLVCTISADPQATSVQWYKYINGLQTSLPNNAMKYNTPTVNSPNLIINSAAQSDDGYYVCTATNIVGTGNSSQIYLTVTGNLPIVTVILPNYNTNIGATVTLGCTIDATPAATNVYWQRIVNNLQQPINTTSSNSRYSGSTVLNPSLVITDVQPLDEGNYICYATNIIGTGHSQHTYINVIGNIPIVTTQERVYSVSIGGNINLVCTIQSNPPHTVVTWQKINKGVRTTVTISGRFSGATVNSPTLTISNVTLDDESYYVCFATNSVGNGQSPQCFLDVIGSIPTVIIASDYYRVNYEQNATIECNVVATPAETSISWQKIQNTVPSTVVITGRYQGGTVSSPNLIIIDVDNTDEAFYICSATNSLGTGYSSQTYLDVQGDAPSVQVSSNYYSVEIGMSVTLQCTVTANPSHTNVTWNKIDNGQQTDIGSNSRYTGGSIVTPWLTIADAVDSDEGFYICTAVNVVGEGQSSQTFLDVIGGILTVTVPQVSYSVNYGQSVQLVCIVTGTPAVQTVFWQKITNGVQIYINSTTDPNKYSGSTIGTPSLTILNADSNDIGSYSCCATNVVGTGESQPTQLSVVGNVPSVAVGHRYIIDIGNSINLTCIIFSTPSASNVQWNRIRNNVPFAINVASNPTKYSGATISTPSLTISNTVEGDEGYYTCEATNSVGTGTSTQTFLIVQGTRIDGQPAIPVVTIAQSQYNVTVGSSVTMDCTVSANPVHTLVSWQKVLNGDAANINLHQTNKYSGFNITSPSLTIINSVIADQGCYTCSAQNSVGTGTSSQTCLEVLGSVPVVTVQPTNYSVNVGYPITLNCSVDAYPTTIHVKWTRYINDIAMHMHIAMSNGRYGGSSVASPSLVISDTVMSDEGFYICTATNVVGSFESRPIFLDVIGSVPNVTVPQPRYTVNIGSSVTLQCIYIANPEATSVIWERTVANQVIIISSAFSKYDGSTTQSPSLIINNADESDEANYVCKVTNSVGTGISASTILVVLGNIPIIITSTPAYTVTIGESVTLTCTVTATPQHTSVYWTFTSGGSTINVNIGGRFSGSSVNASSLTISNVQLSDQGTYVCYATNSVGTGGGLNVILVVIGNVPSVSLLRTFFIGNYGQTIILGCTVSAYPTVTSVYWHKVSGSTTSTVNMSSARYNGSSVDTPSITITNLNSNDAGNYTCLAANSVGTGQSRQGPLTVIGSLPKVSIQQPTYSTKIGNTITLVCEVFADPTHTAVYWTRQSNNGNTETLNPASSTKYSGSTIQSPSLTIFNVVLSDEGNYTCYATNLVGTGQSLKTFFHVIGNAPFSIVIRPSTISVNAGQSITATCTAEGSPIITFTWFKGNSTSQFSNGSILNITSVNRSHAETYQCRAANAFGNSTATVSVDVKYIPDVTITQPSQGAIRQNITIQCSYVSNPDSTNVTWSKGNQGITLDGSKYVGGSLSNPSLTITNLTASDEGPYRCSVVNTVGQGNSPFVILSVDTSVAPYNIRIVPKGIVVQEGKNFTLTCEADGDPAPTYRWYQNDNIVREGAVYTIRIANSTEHDGSILCEAFNSLGRIAANEDVVVQYRPVSTVTQISITQIDAITVRLSCDTRANPSATVWQWFNNGITMQETSKVILVAMDVTNAARTFTCKATNIIGLSPLIPFNIPVVTTTVAVPSPIYIANEDEQTNSAIPTVPDPPNTLDDGEIVAIILACVFVVLLVVGGVVCCKCQAECASLCGGKKERISPQPEPKRVEIPVYYEEPDESVISLRKLEIPKFKKVKTPDSMKHKKDREESYSTLDSKKHKKKRAKHRRNSNVYSRYSEKSFDFEINKFEVLQPEDFKQPDERQLASETIYSDTTCTYDDEEQRRRRWRRKKKKNKRLQDQQMRDNEYILEDKNDNVRYYVPRLGQDMRT